MSDDADYAPPPGLAAFLTDIELMTASGDLDDDDV